VLDLVPRNRVVLRIFRTFSATSSPMGTGQPSMAPMGSIILCTPLIGLEVLHDL
jgi:hypothetical protein